MLISRRGIFALAVATALAAPALAQEIKLPSTLTVTAYDTGSSGFNIAVAVGKAFKDKHGSDVRVLPAGNDVARLAPLKGGRAQASFMGVGVFFAQEGAFGTHLLSRDIATPPLMFGAAGVLDLSNYPALDNPGFGLTSIKGS